MKRIPLLLSSLLLAAPAFAQESSNYAQLSLDTRFGYAALDDDDWKDGAIMADLGLTIWSGDRVVGLWLGIGVEGATLQWDDGWGPVDTDVVAVPFGGSLILRAELLPGIALRAEGGARYVALDIDEPDYDYDHHHHRRYRDADRSWDQYYHPSDYLDIDDTTFAIASLTLEFNFLPFNLGVGGGYQFDLGKPEVTYDGKTIFEADLSSAFFFVSAGIVF